MESLGWKCGRCGHEVPMGNRQVHEVRCARATSPPPTRTESPEPNVFTPSDHPPSAPTAWREVNIPRQTGREGAGSRRPHGVEEEDEVPRPHSALTQALTQAIEQRGQSSATATDTSATRRSSGAAAGRTESEWACKACTFLNSRGRSRCEICGARMPPEERAPDSAYRDTLIGGSGDNEVLFNGPRRRPAATAIDLSAAAAAARCRLLEQVGAMRISSSGGGSGGRVRGTDGDNDDDDNDVPDRGSAMSDAVAGSALGAIGAGVMSAMTPGTQPGGVLASILQGAVVGGVAGAALGSGFRQEPGRDGAGGGGLPRDQDLDRDMHRLFESQLRQARQSGAFDFPGSRRRIVVARDENVLIMMRELRAMGFSDEAAMEILGDSEVRGGAPSRILYRALPGGAGAREEGGARPASARAIAALPEDVLTEDSLSHLQGDSRQCCICMEDFGANALVTRLPCLHLYHSLCINNWLQTSGTCPSCKFRVD